MRNPRYREPKLENNLSEADKTKYQALIFFELDCDLCSLLKTLLKLLYWGLQPQYFTWLDDTIAKQK